MAVANPWAHLGTDVLVTGRDFSPLPTGDVDVVSGLRCLAQDLVHRLGTPRGDLWMHPEYGLDLCRFVHVEGTAVNVLDFQHSVQEEAEKDARVTPGSAKVEVRSWDLDRIAFRLTVLPIGETNPLNLVLGFDLSAMALEVVRG